MHIRGELQKYTGRVFDVSVIHPNDHMVEAPVTLSLWQGGGAVCTGLQKLVQRVLQLLLTPIGSMRFAPERGCLFIPQVLRAQNEEDVRLAFDFAKMRIQTQLATVENTAAEDEQLQDLSLSDVTFFGSTLSIALTIQNKKLEQDEIILPVYL